MRELRAVILCAGQGRRLFPLTRNLPKSLLMIGNRPILEYIIDNVKESGIEPIHIVTGFRKELIENFVREKGYSNVHFVHNEKYATTNTASSLKLAIEEMNSDFVLINGDVFFDCRILEDLLAHPERNCVVVDNAINLDGEEVKVVADRSGRRIVRISKELDPRICLGEAIGINKISTEYREALLKVFDELEQRGEYFHFFENGIDRLVLKNCKFGIQLTDKPWVEIDTLSDLLYAKNEIYRKLFI